MGRKTLRKFQQPQNSDDSYLNENHIDKFEARFPLSERSTVTNEEVSQPMSMHSFFDKYKVSFDKHKKLIVHKRQREKNGVYQSIRLTPHTTMMQANPTRKYYGQFCKKMCLWSKTFWSIRQSVKKFTRDGKDEENEYWINEFNTSFPGGDGLDPIFKAFCQHYETKNDEDTDSDDDIEGGHETNVIRLDDRNHEGGKGNAKRSKPDRYYQTNDDKLICPNEKGNTELPTDEFVEHANRMCNEFIANANAENFIHWLQGENPNNPKLCNRIESCYGEVKELKGVPKAKYAQFKLTKKQELVHRIIMNWVKDRVGERKMHPLWLFVIGVPGAGKTFAFKVTASQLILTLGDKWQENVRFATPTGSVSFHMGFGATTLHQAFYIRVGHVGESYDGLVDKILELQKRLPKSVFLIVFDECSMISRHMFAAICHRLEEASIHTKNIGLIFFGDPAEILPISGLSIWSTQLKNERKKSTELSIEGMHAFRNLMGMSRIDLVPGYNDMHQKYKKISLPLKNRRHFVNLTKNLANMRMWVITMLCIWMRSKGVMVLWKHNNLENY